MIRATRFRKGGMVSREKHKEVKPEGSYVKFVEPQGIDTIPAILADKELVVNRESVKDVLKLIDDHNRINPDRPVKIPGLQDNNQMDKKGDIDDDFIQSFESEGPPVGFKKGGIVQKQKGKKGIQQQTVVNIKIGDTTKRKKRVVQKNRKSKKLMSSIPPNYIPSWSGLSQPVLSGISANPAILNPLRISGNPNVTRDGITDILREVIQEKLAQKYTKAEKKVEDKIDIKLPAPTGGRSDPSPPVPVPSEESKKPASRSLSVMTAPALGEDEEDIINRIFEEEEIGADEEPTTPRRLLQLTPIREETEIDDTPDSEAAGIGFSLAPPSDIGGIDPTVIGTAGGGASETLAERLQEVELEGENKTREQIMGMTVKRLKEMYSRDFPSDNPGWSGWPRDRIVNWVLRKYGK